MAHIDNEKSGFAESLDKGGEGVVGAGAGEHDVAERDVPNSVSNVRSTPNANTSPGPTTSSPSVAQPKKFSSVNINKKFLEKNSGGTPSTSQSSSTAVKSGTSNRVSDRCRDSYTWLMPISMQRNRFCRPQFLFHAWSPLNLQRCCPPLLSPAQDGLGHNL